jgi:histidyl-tRNA synthetase
VNNRKVLDGVMEAIGVTARDAAQKLAVLRAIDKLDKFGVEGVKLLLGPGRWDGGKEGEGDFTPGAGLDDIDISSLVQFVLAEVFVPESDGSFIDDDRTMYEGRFDENAGIEEF